MIGNDTVSVENKIIAGELIHICNAYDLFQVVYYTYAPDNSEYGKDENEYQPKAPARYELFETALFTGHFLFLSPEIRSGLNDPQNARKYLIEDGCA